MTTRSNHGAQLHRRRSVALRNNLERLKLGTTICNDLKRKLTDKDIARMEAENDVLKQRGAS